MCCHLAVEVVPGVSPLVVHLACAAGPLHGHGQWHHFLYPCLAALAEGAVNSSAMNSGRGDVEPSLVAAFRLVWLTLHSYCLSSWGWLAARQGYVPLDPPLGFRGTCAGDWLRVVVSAAPMEAPTGCCFTLPAGHAQDQEKWDKPL